MRNWINTKSNQFPNVEVKYQGGDPRFIITKQLQSTCFRVNEEGVEVAQEVKEYEESTLEHKINNYTEDEIDAYLNSNGFFTNE